VTRVIILLAALAATLGVVGAADATHAVARCRGAQLAGSFTAVRGSAGAGNITYALRLKDTSALPCTLTGLPQGVLLGSTHNVLPTHVRAAFPGALSAVLVTLGAGRTARATARFSPDVPGTGEQMMGPCEPVAWSFRVAGQGGGDTVVPISPRTSVCEHGRLLFSAYGPGS
jgi:Protein of unknown function (DUF4232)